MNSTTFFENINYELASLYHEFDGDIEKINNIMRTVPELFTYPFLMRELDSTTHKLCCQITAETQTVRNMAISAFDVSCIVTELFPSGLGLDYRPEDWQIAVVLNSYYKSMPELMFGDISARLTDARLKKIEELLAVAQKEQEFYDSLVELKAEKKPTEIG